MQKLVISAPALDANPMVVMQILRAIGGKVRVIAELLSKKQPLIDENFPDRPDAAQVARIRGLMKVLEHAVTPPKILLDGREIQPLTLNEIIESAEKMQMRPAGAPDSQA